MTFVRETILAILITGLPLNLKSCQNLKFKKFGKNEPGKTLNFN